MDRNLYGGRVIDTNHWGAAQYLLIAFLFVTACLDVPALHRHAKDTMRTEARDYPSIVYGASIFGALVVPVVTLILTCWGGFFS
jgi:hypothetical protein